MKINISNILIAASVFCASLSTVSADTLDAQAAFDRLQIFSKIKEASNTIDLEVKRLIDLANQNKLKSTNTFYTQRINSLEKEIEKADTLLSRRINDFLIDHPSDPKSAWALFKLANLYLEHSNKDYRNRLEKYYKDLENGKTGEYPKKDLTLPVKTLAEIDKNFPYFEHSDSVLYLLGYCYLSEDSPEKAERIYKKLLSDHPKSKYIAESFLRLGEYHFAKKSFKRAVASYDITLRFKNGKFYDKALYKQAWSYYLMRQYDSAGDKFLKLLEYSSPFDQEDQMLAEFKKDAQTYVAFSLFKKNDLKGSIAFLKRMGSRDYAYSVFNRLGDIYRDRGFDREAISIYRLTIKSYPDGRENPAIHRAILESLDKIYATAQMERDLYDIIDLYSYNSSWRTVNRDFEKENKTADELLEMGLYNLSIRLDRKGRKQNDSLSVRKATDYYKMLIKYFPRSEKAYNAQYYLAEAYLYLKDLKSALASYDGTLRNNFYSRYFKDALFNEIIVYEEMIKEEGGLEKLKGGKGEEIPDLANNLLNACDLYTEKYPQDDRSSRVLYRSAEVYENFSKTEQALSRYSKVIEKYPGSDLSKDSLKRTLNVHINAGNWLSVIDIGNKYLADPFAKDEEFSKEVYEIVAAANFNVGVALESEGKHLEAGEALAKVSLDYKDSKIAEDALKNAFLSFKNSKEIAKATEGINNLTKNHSKSTIAPLLILEIADREYAWLNFDRAYKDYRRIIDEYAKTPYVDDAYLRIASLKEATGNFEEASNAYLSFSKITEEKELKKEALLKTLIYSIKLKDYRTIDLLVTSLERLFKGDRKKLSLAYLILAERHFNAKNPNNFAKYMKLSEKYLDKPGSLEPEVLNRYHRLKIDASESLRNDFLNIELKFPQAKFIRAFEKKALILEKLEKVYLPIIKNGTLDLSSEALYKLAHSYQNIGESVRDVSLPENMEEEIKARTKEDIAKISEPLINKARSAYMKNITEAKKYTFTNQFVEKSTYNFATMIGSDTMKNNLALDFKYRYRDDIYFVNFLSSLDAESNNKKSISSPLFDEGFELASKNNASKEELKRALFLFDQAYRYNKDFKEARFNKALASLLLGNYDVAQFIYSSLTKNEDFAGKALVNLAFAYYKQGSLDKPISLYTKYLSDNPDDVEILCNLAFMERMKGNLDKSLEISKKVLALSNYNERAYNNAAIIYKQRNEFEKALSVLKRGLEYNPESGLIKDNLAAFYLEQKKYIPASNILKDRKDVLDQDMTSTVNWAYLLLKTGNYEEGLNFSKKMWDDYPSISSALYLNVGLGYLSLMEKDAAIKHINSNFKFAGPFVKEAKLIITDADKKEGGNE